MKQILAEPATTPGSSNRLSILVMRWELCELEVLIVPVGESFKGKLKRCFHSGHKQIGSRNFSRVSRRVDFEHPGR